MAQNLIWLDWAVRLQALAQAGLYYGKDPFDRERYAEIRSIAAQMIAHQGEMPFEKVQGLFCCETRLRSWIPGQPSSGMTGSCWYRRRTAPGPCRAVGWMWTCPCWKM